MAGVVGTLPELWACGWQQSLHMNDIEQSLTTGSGAQGAVACFVCHKPIADSQWFCRLPRMTADGVDPRGTKILLCSPGCALSYFGELQPNVASLEASYAGRVQLSPIPAGTSGAEEAKPVGAQTTGENKP